MFEITFLHVINGLFHKGSVFRMNPLQNKLHAWPRRWVALVNAKSFLGPEHLSARHVPAEAACLAQSLCFGQIGLTAPKLRFGPLALAVFRAQLVIESHVFERNRRLRGEQL